MSDEVEALKREVAKLAARVEALESLAEARALAVPLYDLGSRSLNSRYAYAREWEAEISSFQAGLLLRATADPDVATDRLQAMKALGERIANALRSTV